MAMGGVPHYLNEIEARKSAAQNIDAICFSENGLLWDEFPKLYASLFENSEAHVKIIRTLAGKQKGLTRSEIVQNSRLPEGRGASTVIGELLISGLFQPTSPLAKRKRTRCTA